jgi:hypothetical protein
MVTAPASHGVLKPIVDFFRRPPAEQCIEIPDRTHPLHPGQLRDGVPAVEINRVWELCLGLSHRHQEASFLSCES